MKRVDGVSFDTNSGVRGAFSIAGMDSGEAPLSKNTSLKREHGWKVSSPVPLKIRRDD